MILNDLKRKNKMKIPFRSVPIKLKHKSTSKPFTKKSMKKLKYIGLGTGGTMIAGYLANKAQIRPGDPMYNELKELAANDPNIPDMIE